MVERAQRLAVIAARADEADGLFVVERLALVSVRIDAVRPRWRRDLARVELAVEGRAIGSPPAAMTLAAADALHGPFCEHGTQDSERKSARLLMYDPLCGLPAAVAAADIEK